MRRAAVVLLTLMASVTAAAQVTSGGRTAPFVAGGPDARLHPVWGHLAYSLEEFNWKARDFGLCTPDSGLGLVFCGVRSGDVLALSIVTGQKIWSFHTKGSVRTAPAVTPTGLFVGSSDGCMYRLDARNGKPLWKEPYCTDAAVWGGPTVVDGRVYFAVTINKLYAVSAEDGSFLWEYHHDRPQFMSAEGVASPLVAGDRVYVGFSDGTLAALDRVSGEPAWSVDLAGGKPQTDVDTTPVLDGDVLYAAAFGEGPVALHLSDGSQIWRGRWFGCTRPVLTGDAAVFGTSDGEVVSVRKSDGAPIFVTLLKQSSAFAPVLVADVVVAAGDQGLYAIDAASGFPKELLTVNHGVATAPAVLGRRIFFVSGGGMVDAVDVKPR